MVREIAWILLVFVVLCGASPYFNVYNHNSTIEPEYLDMLLEKGQYEEFSKVLGISVNLVKPSTNPSVKKYPRYNKELYMGDIMLTSRQKEMARQGKNFETEPEARWPRTGIPYSIASNFTRRTRRAIMRAINHWNAKLGTCLMWRPRMRFIDRQYVYFFPGDGCSSTIGRTLDEVPQTLSIDNDGGCDALNTVLHEMEHTIGMEHEHVRIDRDNYVRVIYENIPADFKDQYIKQTRENGVLLGEYDYYSIMHYTYLAPGSDDKPAFEILQDDVDLDLIGNSPDFTDKDINKIELLYNCN